MYGKVGLAVAVGFGVWNGIYVFQPWFEDYQKEKSLRGEYTPTPLPKPRSPVPARTVPEHLQTEEEKRRWLKSVLPSTVVAASAHPDHAAKVMDSPLPAMRLTAKKIPTKQEAGEMQAEPYSDSTLRLPAAAGSWYGKMKFW